MKIKNFTGYMLGNEHSLHQIGAPWMGFDAHVWACPNLAKAKKVLAESHRRMCLEPHAVWTIVYQVSGRDMVFEQANNGLLYTETPTKLYVDRIVLNKQPDLISEEFLLRNAQQQSEFFDLVSRRVK